MTNGSGTNDSRKNYLRIALVTVMVLAVPFIAMQFSDEVEWSWVDFLVAGALLLGTGVAYEILGKRLRTGRQQAAAAAALFVGLAIVWAELAVGLFG